MLKAIGAHEMKRRRVMGSDDEELLQMPGSCWTLSNFTAAHGGAVARMLAMRLRETPRVYLTRKLNQDFAFGRVGGAQCRMHIYVDGMYKREANPSAFTQERSIGDEGVGLNEIVAFSNIKSLEIYPSASSVPTRFARIGPGAGSQTRGGVSRIPASSSLKSAKPSQADNVNQDAACGAVVIWTK